LTDAAIHSGSGFTPAQVTALDWLAAQRAALSSDHLTIWHFHEPSWREYKSCQWYVDRLRREGFDVEHGTAGMPTAFRARWSNGAGPTLASYAEYDAVPGQSQAPVAYRRPRDGVSRHAAGHTDPHSALGIGAFAGFLGTKQVMQTHGIGGTLVFFGEPAEKMCGAKPVHAAHGFYDGLDAAFSFHPHSFPALTNGCFWETSSAPYWSRIYTFTCEHPETWQTAAGGGGGVSHVHASARAPGAIDAVCMMYLNSKMMKESMLPHSGSWTLNEFIPIAGQATADNITPAISQIQYAMRGPTLEMCQAAFDVLDRNADHIAAMTLCSVEKSWITKTRAGLPNKAMAEVTFRNFARLGAPQWDQAAKLFARELQASLGLVPMPEPFFDGMMKLTPPWEAEAAFRAQLPPWQMHYAADDYVDYTWHAPTVRLYVARPTLQPPTSGFRYPDWVRHAMGGVPDCIDPMWHRAAEVIATTAIDLLTDPSHLARAQAEFRERTGGGIGGSQWVAPLLPPDFVAPVFYRWPEYVTTPRGEEWTIP
jgi:aminobenzoyl-glutamate utilization protein B